MSQLFSQALSETQSQNSTQSRNQSSSTTISLTKFSHATCAPGARTFTWTHIGQRDDLSLVFCSARLVDHNGNLADRFLMKINAGAELLETQDLGDLVNHSREFDPSSGAEHPVQVVVKCPFLAMRYPKNHTTVRRVQIKFNNDTDYHVALNVLKDLGLPISENVPPRAAVTPAPSVLSTTSTLSAGTMQGSISRPASAMPSLSSSFGPPLHTPALTGFKTTSFSANEVPVSSSTAFGDMRFPTPSMIRPASTSVLGPTQSLYFPQSYEGIRPLSVAGGPNTLPRTMSASPWFSKDHFGGMSGITEDPFSQNTERSTSLEFMIPPKRKLPFSTTPILPPRLSPVKEAMSESSTQPRPLTPTHKPVKKRVASRKPPPVMKAVVPVDQVVSSSADGGASQEVVAAVENPKLQSKAALPKKRATASVRPPAGSKRSKMVDGATQTQTLSGRDHTALHRNDSCEREQGLAAPHAPTPPSPESPPENYLDAIDTFVAKCKYRPAPRDFWQTPGYEDASEEERDIMLNDFICDNLDDPGFLQLCEDTERAWRRIGLGM